MTEEVLCCLSDRRRASAAGLVRDALLATALVSGGLLAGLRAWTSMCFVLVRIALAVLSKKLQSRGLCSLATRLRAVQSGASAAHAGVDAALGKVYTLLRLGTCSVDALLVRLGASRHFDSLRLLLGHGHRKDALLNFLCFVGMLELHAECPLALARGFAAVRRAHSLERRARISRREEEEAAEAQHTPPQRMLQPHAAPRLSTTQVRQWEACAKWSSAAYFGPEKRGPGAAFELHTGFLPQDVVHRCEGGGMYSPAHLVAVDARRRVVAVVVRGTIGVNDMLVDLVGDPAPFSCLADEATGELVAGRAHRGFLASARRLAASLERIVGDMLLANPGFDLVLTGHSMGGACASIVALMWAQSRAFGDRTDGLRALAFGPGCSLCHELSQTPFARKYVTSVVCADDVVCRLNHATTVELFNAVKAFGALGARATRPTAQEHREVLRAVPREPLHSKLFPAGRVYHLDSAEFDQDAREIDPRQDLASLHLEAGFLAAHYPSRYERAVDNLSADFDDDALGNPQEAEPSHDVGDSTLWGKPS